ncbi:hypothetical protein [Burkholderia multivorans]|uniref:hypothetical protein n=1 Tax=Burkholderia multivorans TaxID=87883 RepID=UPI002159190E|nr:hypothetical protein [Burkholderia multivorans]
MDTINELPELEACGWFVRTKRTEADPAGWLVADCSAMADRGARLAKLFAAAPEMARALRFALDSMPDKTSGTRIVLEAALLNAGLLEISKPGPRFENVSCSSCGQDFGPGDEGFSSCKDHADRRVRHIRICGDGV